MRAKQLFFNLATTRPPVLCAEKCTDKNPRSGRETADLSQVQPRHPHSCSTSAICPRIARTWTRGHGRAIPSDCDVANFLVVLFNVSSQQSILGLVLNKSIPSAAGLSPTSEGTLLVLRLEFRAPVLAADGRGHSSLERGKKGRNDQEEPFRQARCDGLSPPRHDGPNYHTRPLNLANGQRHAASRGVRVV